MRGRSEKLYQLVKGYRSAITKAYESREFSRWPFNQFPDGCCAPASDILARFLSEHHIFTKVVSGRAYDTTHAWLVLDDDVLRSNLEKDKITADIEIIQRMNQIIEAYGISNNEIYSYHSFDFVLEGCTIIDITGSQTQFRSDSKYLNYRKSIYIGKMDQFHSIFDIMNINDFFIDDNLDEVYRIVQQYLPDVYL